MEARVFGMGNNGKVGFDQIEPPSIWIDIPDQKWLRNASDMDIIDGETTDRTNHYALYEEYYDGKHGTELLSRAQQYLMSRIPEIEYAENVCDLVVDAMADRLTIKGWKNATTEDEITEALDDFWTHNNMPEVHKTAIGRTIELGDGFLIVDWNAEAKMAEIHFNPPHIVKAEYDRENAQKMTLAVKVWNDNKTGPANPSGQDIQRMNIYYEDRIERYFTVAKDGDWSPYWDEDETQWPLPWTRDNEPGGEARGIPVFHMKNKARGNTYGTSELAKVIPLQNSLNKLWLDLFEIADSQGFPQRWGTGVSKADANNVTSGSGTMVTSSSETAKFGQFAAADLNQIVNLIDTRYRTIAGVTYTPVHMLVLAKGILSGEALKKSEAGLVAKVKDRQPGMGLQISSAVDHALTIMSDNSIETKNFTPGETKIEPIWTEAENIDEMEKIEVAEGKRRAGIPLKQVLMDLGYKDVEAIMAMVKEELEMAEAARPAQQGQSAKTTATNDSEKNADGKKTPQLSKKQLKATGRNVEQ